uniref:Retrotransposon protein, putative, Ty1-copia subclass n=1 Tax=Tanacetum cinerariifolium TaxID=118510 RepID=A0A6L2P1Y3_TANCI|nr:hypothetical protein [Tanacetum cinerariifolium]
MAQPVQNLNHSAFSCSPYEMLQKLKFMFEKQAGVKRATETSWLCAPQDLGVGLIMNGLISDFSKFGFPKKAATPQVMVIQCGKIQKANKKLQNDKGKGKDKLVYIPKPKNAKPYAKEHPTKDDTCNTAKELALPVLQGLRGVRKLKQGALYLYVGNGIRAQVETIGSFNLVLPNGIVICLDNCHYAPTLTRGVVLVFCLVDNGFIQCFTDYGISVSKNDVLYFNAIPRDGIYEIDMLNLVPNVNSIYNVSNKIAKHNLDSTHLWHCCLAHISKKRIENLQRDGLLNSTDDESFDQCVFYLSGKMKRKPFPHRTERATDLLGLIHIDVCGPLRHVSRQGASYFITFIDDYIRYGYVYLLKHKHERLTPPYTPQHNVVSGRRNRTLLDMVQSTMNLTTPSLSFWDYALESAIRILNMVPTNKVDKTPYELWYGEVPNFSYLKETMGYYFYFPPENKIVFARYAEFLEKNIISQEVSGRAVELEEIQDEDTSPSENTSEIHVEVEEVEEHNLGDLSEPTNYKAAMLDPESDKWLDAINAEMQSMKDNKVWCVVDLPPNGKTVESKWFFKKKTDMDGIVHTYKDRLVAKGFTQTFEVDYKETFSPVDDTRAICILIAIAVFYDYEIWKMDVKTAFLNGYLVEDIYMVQPEGFVDPKHPKKVCKLQRFIYGLKQASRSWNKRFNEEIKKFVFAQNVDEPCVYQKDSGSNVTFLILYVDEIIIMGNNISSLQSVKTYLGKCFAIKYLGEATFILGIKIYRDRSKQLIGLSQSAYMDKILKRFRMDTSKRGYILMQERLDLNKTQGTLTPEEVKRMQNVPYALTIGSIMYAVRCTRPDVAFAQNITSRFQQNPVDWKSFKQSTTTMSATEAEYIAASEAAMEVVWIRKFISGLGIVPKINEPIKMFCDNSAVTIIANEPGVQKDAIHY